MSALVAALYRNHAQAEDIRTQLVTLGFATDRVQLTSREELGPAGLTPADDTVTQLRQYFAQVFTDESESADLEAFVKGIRDGNAAVVVHPRGDVEVEQARQLLARSQPLRSAEHEMENQAMERAASHDGATIVGKVVPEGLTQALNPRKN